jgi:hypothetical protein
MFRRKPVPDVIPDGQPLADMIMRQTQNVLAGLRDSDLARAPHRESSVVASRRDR